MKIFSKFFTVSLFLVITFVAMTSDTFAQCVACDIEGGCFFCVSATEGGRRCQSTCTRCLLDGTCGPGFRAGGVSANGCSDEGTTKTQTTRSNLLKVDAETIRQIATVHPRFAATLADISRNGGLRSSYATMRWSSIEITTTDIEEWLKSDQEFFAHMKKLDKKARNLGEAPLIIYEITMEKNLDSSQATLKLRVLQASPTDPPYTSMVIDLATTKLLKENENGIKWEVKNWKIN